MSTNPFCPQYTAAQQHRIAAGRASLLARWRAAPYREGQPTTFGVVHDSEQLDGERLIDVFVASPAAPRFSEAWRREVETNGAFAVEHGARRFTLLVEHRYYLEQQRLPVSVDGACASRAALQAVAAVAVLYAAFLVGASGPTSAL